MTRLILCGDLHQATRGPASRTDNWTDAVFHVMDQVKALAIKTKAQGIVFAGDIFHSRSRVNFELLTRMLGWLRELDEVGVYVMAIAGNHDLVHEQPESLDSGPLGVLFRSGLLWNVGERPWSNGTVKVAGVPYPMAKDLQALRTQATAMGGASNQGVLVVHAFGDKQPGDLFGDHIHGYGELFDLPYDVVLWGHDHRDHGVYKLAGESGHEQWHVNTGSMERGSFSNEDVNRGVKVALVTFEERKVDVVAVQLNVPPASDVFDVEKKETRNAERERVEEFVRQLAADVATSSGGFTERVQALALPEAVRERVLRYIEEAE